MDDNDFIDWKNSIYTALTDISDLETQKLSWAGRLPDVVSSFAEVVNTLYDYDFENFIDYLYANGYNPGLVSELKELNMMISNYDEADKTQSDILNDNRWILITKKAGEIVNSWNSL